MGPWTARAAAGRLFQTLDEAMADSAGDDERDRFKLLFAAALQGTASLVAGHRITPERGETLAGDAMDALLASELGTRVLPERERQGR